MPTRKAAFFDIDGTLIRGLLIVDFPRYLVGKDCFDGKFERQIRTLAQLYRKGLVTYRHISTRIPKLYAMGIEGQAQSKVRVLANDFILESRHRLLPYAEGLVSLMTHGGFFTVAVSGSPIEVISPLKPLGFAKVLGTSMEVRRGAYTGKVVRNLILAEEKKRVVGALIKQYHLDAENSFAFGDTEQDLPLLSAVGNPIPLNPSPALRAFATGRGWLIPSAVLKEVKARIAVIDAQ